MENEVVGSFGRGIIQGLTKMAFQIIMVPVFIIGFGVWFVITGGTH